jgi:hypothetical protein
MVSRMRVLSSPTVVENAGMNKTFNDVTEILDDKAINPLRTFSIACREELWGQNAAEFQ